MLYKLTGGGGGGVYADYMLDLFGRRIQGAGNIEGGSTK